MTTIHLGETTAGKYSVIGEEASNCGDVRHVGLLAHDDDLRRGKRVRVFDMGRHVDMNATMCAHAVGYLEGRLTEDERDGIDAWLSQLRTYNVLCDYWVKPASRADEPDPGGRIQHRWFSCAGLVASVYEEGALVKLVVEEDVFPESSLKRIAEIWGRGFPADAFRRLMKRYGLDGEGPWRVLLPGYLLHALDKLRPELPYTPHEDDWQFPRPCPTPSAGET
jgi:hypothetical protein